MGRVLNIESGKRPLVLLGFVVVLLILSVILSFKFGPFKSSFRVEEALICQELDGSRQPLRVGNNIPYGVRQVCLWLKYVSAREGAHLDVSWYYEKDQVLSEKIGLTVVDGVRAVYLLREEGDALPSGNYGVTISASGRVCAEIDFCIEKK